MIRWYLPIYQSLRSQMIQENFVESEEFVNNCLFVPNLKYQLLEKGIGL